MGDESLQNSQILPRSVMNRDTSPCGYHQLFREYVLFCTVRHNSPEYSSPALNSQLLLPTLKPMQKRSFNGGNQRLGLIGVENLDGRDSETEN